MRPDDVAALMEPFTIVGRSGRQEKFAALELSKGFSQMYVNSSMRYGATVLEEAEREATKVRRRVLAEMSSWRVGQDEGTAVVDVGVYEYFVMPEDLNWESRSWAEALSEFTSRTVTTVEVLVGFLWAATEDAPSLGFASIQLLIADNQSLSLPASNRSQLVWHRCHSPLF
jgi:hypothetical protein